jgi:hypothetical protein
MQLRDIEADTESFSAQGRARAMRFDGRDDGAPQIAIPGRLTAAGASTFPLQGRGPNGRVAEDGGLQAVRLMAK